MVEEWVELPSARLRPPALEDALAGALRERLGSNRPGASDLDGANGPDTSAGAAR